MQNQAEIVEKLNKRYVTPEVELLAFENYSLFLSTFLLNCRCGYREKKLVIGHILENMRKNKCVCLMRPYNQLQLK